MDLTALARPTWLGRLNDVMVLRDFPSCTATFSILQLYPFRCIMHVRLSISHAKCLQDMPDPMITEARPGPPRRVIPPVRILACRVHIATATPPHSPGDQRAFASTFVHLLVMLVAKQLSAFRKQLFDYFAAVHVGDCPRSANALYTFTRAERRHPPRRQHDRLPHHRNCSHEHIPDACVPCACISHASMV